MPDAHVDHAADDQFQTAVAGLLRRVPERWAEYGADSLTATESKALFLLVAAGMIERRIRFRVRLHNHPVAVEVTVTATGEHGFAEAMQPVLGAMWTDLEGCLCHSAQWRSVRRAADQQRAPETGRMAADRSGPAGPCASADLE